MPELASSGQLIAQLRTERGWSRRKLASKVGISTRRMLAIETDTEPEPRRESRQYYTKFFESLGYAKRTYTDWPMRDKNFDLEPMQARVLRFLNGD